jgi:hypothetical protein
MVRKSLFSVSLFLSVIPFPQSPPLPSPEARAVTFLAREVPRWRQEHPCYSCHNNGDAARALLAARAQGPALKNAVNGALDDTLTWLRAPSRWDANASTGGFDDKPLARIQFGGALASAVETAVLPRDAIAAAATLIARDQNVDGSWRRDASQSLGSPATYGTALSTWAARRTLVAAQAPNIKDAIARADRWLRTFEPTTVPDAAATVLGLERATDAAALSQRARALEVLRRGQSSDGGWGPYTSSPPEPFDTALAVLALSAIDEALAAPVYQGNARTDAIARGRQFLIDRQLPDGSWPETTRPAGQESYAQRISTAGWATLALLEKQP